MVVLIKKKKNVDGCNLPTVGPGVLPFTHGTQVCKYKGSYTFFLTKSTNNLPRKRKKQLIFADPN